MSHELYIKQKQGKGARVFSLKVTKIRKMEIFSVLPQAAQNQPAMIFVTLKNLVCKTLKE